MYYDLNFRKFSVSVLAALFLSQQTLLIPAFASEITGVNGNNGQYNINPDVIKGDMGFRHYNKFKLDKGDIANLIYGSKYNKFVNLVDTRININGILNTVGQDGNFYNGHAIFVSPMGMVVGSSGVLNVGSLTAIAPAPIDYLKYTGFYMGQGYMEKAADAIGIDYSAVTIPGVTDDVNLKLLKESQSESSIDINGKIFARGNVELLAKNINVKGDNNSQAAIFAGIPKKYDEKIATLAQASNLFDNLVASNIKSGNGFDRDGQGNIIIKAQSVQKSEIQTPLENLQIKGAVYALNLLFDIVDGVYVIKENLPPEVTSDDVKTALELAQSVYSPLNGTNPNVINGDTLASVDISNAVLGGKNIDINAVSKAEYTAEKGFSIFDRMVNSVVDSDGNFIADLVLSKITSSSASFDDFEGSRAKASVNIGENTQMAASNDVSLKALSFADTSIKVKSLFSPNLDNSSTGFYYLGSKTISDVIVGSGADIIAGNDINIISASKNSMNLKIQNPTSKADSAAGAVFNAPSVQVSVLKSVVESDTNAEIQNGAKLKAGHDVNVLSSNVTSDQSVLNSVANILPPSESTENAGIAVSLSLKDTNINTNTKVDGTIEAVNDANITAQNMHVSSNVSKAEVTKASMLQSKVMPKIASKVTDIISSKLSGITDGLENIKVAGSVIPSTSAAVVVNDSNINTNVTVTKNANIKTGNDINLKANTVDLTVNNATTKVDIPAGGTSSGGSQAEAFKPAPGVAVIVNNQKNNTNVTVEDGTKNNRAVLNAGGNINASATLEQPMNQTTFELALNLMQTYTDTKDMFNEESDNLSKVFKLGDSDEEWDIRELVQDFTNPASEVMSDISNIMFGVKNSGLTNLGLQGFFNNWAQSTSTNPTGTGLAASVVVSDVLNNTTAKIGNYTLASSNNTIINAANSVTQFNAAGDVAKIWGITKGVSGANGMGGSIIVEKVDSNAKAMIADDAVITANNNIDINAANNQNFLTVAVTGGQSTTNNGFSITGSTVVQDVNGTTEASVGKSKIKAKNLTLNAGKAKIAKVPTALEQLEKDPFEDLDSSKFEVGYEEDLSSPEIRRFTDSDINLGIDTKLGFAEDDKTSTSTIVGSGKLKLNDEKEIKDGISNIMITGALAQQAQSGVSGGSGTTGSSGVAVGASVNVSEFSRNVQAYIKDGASIELEESLNVLSDTKTQSLNVAVAGAFAGGINMKKEPGFLDNKKTQLKNKADGYLTKLKGLLSKAEDLTSKGDTSPVDTGKLDEKGNPILSYQGKEYKTDLNGQYYSKDGTVLKDSQGNVVKANNSLSGKNEGISIPDGSTNKNKSGKNMSAALAGSVNAQINDSTVSSKIGNAEIIVGKDVNVKANQTTKSLNVGGGIAKASTVGAGAAVNFVQNSNNTNAELNGAKIKFTGNSDNKLAVKAEENNDNIQVAIGVGAATNDPNNASKVSVSAGGSFNTDILENSVIANVENSTVENIDSKNTIDADINAENHSTSYKGAGGLNVNTGKLTANVGAGMGGNLNIINKTTKSSVNNSTINNAKNVNVVSNRDKSKKTEALISVGVGGSVVTGGKSAYTFFGALGTDIVNNDIIAEIINSSVITASENVSVEANNNFSNGNITGALGFSASAKGGSLGVGSVLNILNNNISSTVSNSAITAKTVDVTSYNKEDLKFLAVNLGVQTNGSSIDTNGIVNVVKNKMVASVIDSQIVSTSDVNVSSLYDTKVSGITGVGAISAGKGIALGANVLSNSLLSNNSAYVSGSDIVSVGKLTVNATSNDDIDVVPIAAAITASGQAAAAANIGVNVVSNTTKAYIDKSENNNSKIKAGGIDVLATDYTNIVSRGGTVAVAAAGTASVAGSIAVDVISKNIESYIDNSLIQDGGDINVKAASKNIFGAEDPGAITASSLTSDITDGSYDASTDARFDKWNMSYDVSASKAPAISGTVISKTVANDVNSYIGSNTTIANAESVNLSALNKTNASAIIGNVAVGSQAAVGASLFTNVNSSDVSAGIKSGAKIGTESKVGDITISADSIQDYHSINFAVGASSSAAVTGSVNSNIVVNETTAYIENGTDINSNGKLDVNASDSMDAQNFQLAVAGSSGASVGVISNTNVLNNKVNSIVGKSDNNERKGTLSFGKDVNISALSEQNYQANVLMVAGSGSAAVGGIVISNTMASDVNSGIENTTLISDNGKIDVSADSSFNKKHKNQTTGIGKLLKDDKSLNKTSLTTDDLESSDMVPLVSILNIAGTGGAAVSGSVVNNNVITSVNSYVKNSEVSSANGLNVNANSSMTTYDAVMGVAGSGDVAVTATGVVNSYAGKTFAEISDSNIKGSATANATDESSLNTIIFNIAGSSSVSVVPVINSNTVSNRVIAQITNSEITNAATVDVLSSNNLSVNDIILAGSGAGTGVAVNAVPITNVFVGDTSAYISNSKIDGAITNVGAYNNIDTISLVLGISGAGIGASVSGYVLTNVFDNDLNAQIDNSIFTNAKQTNTNAVSNLEMTGAIVSGGVVGGGESIILNAITNVVKNNINSEIARSSITGGSVSVAGVQNSYIYNNTSAVSGTASGGASAVNSLTSVFTNNINAFLTDTDISNATTVSVLADSLQDIENINIGVSASGTVSNSANSIVNVLENTSYAKISAGSKSIKSNGKLSVNAKDTLKLRNSMGMLSIGGYEAAGANINVNVINNAVKAELLSNTDGSIVANNIETSADSSIALKEIMTSASGGVAGISGNVIVNSIGSKFADDDSNLKDAKLSDTMAKTDENYENTSGSVSYSKNGEAKTIDEAYSLTEGTNKEGTVANINANVTATGTASSSDKSAVKVSAKNVVKGYDSDTFSLTNATAAGGLFAAGASVLVNSMKYNTVASIDGGKITAEKGNVDVTADSAIKAKIDTVKATAGAVSIGGNVGYFNNKSNTTAQISNSVISAKDVSVKANSLDNIALNIISASVGKIDANLSLALNTTSNTVNSYITGSDVYITADTIDVIATNNSTLKSQLDSLSVGRATFGLVINRAESNAITNAIVNATGSITANGLSFIAQSNGITAETTMNLGNIAGLSLSYTNQGAFVNSEFKAGIDNENLVVNNSGKTKILSGVSESNNSNAAEMKAKVIARKASATLAEGSLTSLNAGVNAKTESILKAKHNSDSLDIASKLKRTADVGSSTASLGAISISGLNMKSSANGNNNITIDGENNITGNVLIDLNDEANANTSMLNASLSILGADVNNSIADINTDTTITLGGKFNANDVSVKQTVKRNSYNTAESVGGGLVKVDIYKLQTSSKGNSQVDILADMTDENYKNALTVDSVASNKTQSILSSNAVALAAISQDVSSNTLSANNKINLKNAKIKSKGNVNLNALSENKASMKKDAKGSGAVIVLGGELNNNINSSADIIFDSSKISAKNINLSATADLGTVDNKEILYNIGISGANVKDKTYITNDVSQTSNINVKNSELSVTDGLNSKVKTTSEFKQKIDSDGKGFVAKNVSKSKLSVTNNNNFTVDKSSKLYANKVDIAMDSSNRLDSKVDIKVGHFGGLDPDGNSEINLTVNNKLDNKGSIKAGELAQIDLMKNSRNILNQDTSVVVEASVATAKAGGGINYTVNNDVKIAKGADISSGKDVIMNYSNGNNSLNSRIYSKKTSRLLFGIPIVKKKQYSSVTQNTNNSLALDGEVVAGSSSKRYMKINKDGTVDTSTIQGFVDGEYKVVDAVTKSGEELTAETIADLNDKINELKTKINELNEDSADYQADIVSYTAQIAELTNLYNDVKSRNSITPDDVANSMKNNIKSKVVLANNETNDSKVSESVFNRIYEGADGLETDFKSYLDNFVVKAAEGDNPEVKLSDSQKTLIMNSYNAEIDKVQDVGGGAYSVYEGKVIATAEELNTIKNELYSSIGSLSNAKNDLQSSINNINSSITTINSNIDSYSEQITYLTQHPLSDVNVTHPAIEFDNLVVLPSKIELNGIKNTDISGKGNFKTYMPNLVIDNYSTRNLVFKNIDLMAGNSAGLNINGKNYSRYANTLKQVNHANSFDKTPDTVIGSTVHFIADNDASKSNNVTINNYFDSLNPALTLAEAITSDITFGGYISAANKLDVLNESGDIFFNNFINTGSKDITATQGNIVYNAGGTDLELKAGDRMLAGKDITVTAKDITIDGTLQAGYEDRNLIITDDMLNDLVVDPTTGEKNMVNLGTTDKSAYLESSNNIKVIYKDGKLLVFNTKQEGGNVKLTGNVKGQGTVKYTNGYADVTITNNTNKELVINTLENNRMNGEFTNRGTIANVIKQGKDKATTTVSSNGKVNVIGSILNGKGKIDSDLVSDLTVSSNNGIDIAYKVNETGLSVPTIDSIGNVNLNNTGSSIEVNGIINTKDGNINITNESSNGGIKLATTAALNNEYGNINISNVGTQGVIVEGIINTVNKDINITNKNSDLVIGEYDSENDNYIKADNGNVIINQINGNILNGITDVDSAPNQNHDRGNVDKSYKTLISSSGDLTLDVKDGNIGSDSHALANKESGFGINASTRDYTESLNVNVKGKIKANAENNGNALINIRAKESGLNVDAISSDGNVMLTASDWKQADENPARADSEYLTGYSINNSSADDSTPNVTGRNISLISSNNVGDKNKSFTYNQTDNGSISILAENNINISGKGAQDNIWQLISKNGNISLDLNGNASIREITAAKNLKLISKGHNLTIYDLGKISNALSADDILFPHDGIDISGIIPETIEIQVLDTNSETQDSLKGNSTLNIFNAYVKGNNSSNPDVILKADNIIAHAYDAPSSTISNSKRPNGFDAKTGRTYSNDYTDSNADKNLKASGFNTVGDGGMLSFEISGVSTDDVSNAGSSTGSRNYNSQNPVDSSKEFKNPNGFKDTVYKAKDVTLSLNSSNDNAPTDNRGLQIDKIYADNAYIDTKDLNLNVIDGFITNYGEFRNGNRGGSTGGNYISEDYRWSAIVDNDFNRNLINLFPKTATTLQIFTKKTGSFGLSLGDTIASNTKAPVVVYDPDINIVIPRTENSFYRLTYKDNKIQVNTTDVDYEEFEETQLHQKREFIRFGVVNDNDGFIKVVDKKYPDKNRIISLENISRGGLLVVHDGSMKEKERFFVDISYGDINVTTEVEVVRLSAGNKAGLKFINLDKATANKILYMNMALEENASPKVKVSSQM